MPNALRQDELTRYVSCRATKSLFQYLTGKGYDVRTLVDGLPYSYTYLNDPLNWIPNTVRDILCDRAALLSGDERVMFQVGLNTPQLNSIGGLDNIIRLFASPKMLYKILPRYMTFFDKKAVMKIKSISSNNATVTLTLGKKYLNPKSGCLYTQGLLAAIPTLWHLPPADVHEIQCMHTHGDADETASTADEEKSCIYKVTWQQNKINKEAARQNDLINKIEDSFLLLEQKNAELRRQNTMLAKVREITLAVDGVKSEQEIYSTIVETARDIAGIRFVVLQAKDDTGKYLVAQYHSLIRDEACAALLKPMLGDDLNNVFGNDNASRRWRLPIDRVKVYSAEAPHLQACIFESLADIFGDLWSKEITDCIQKTADLKKFVIVPIAIDGAIVSNLLFFLDDDVQLDILEMIGAHCAMALRNIPNLEAMKKRNQELSAMNAIALEINQLLDSNKTNRFCVEQIQHIFQADAVTIHLKNQAENALNLISQCCSSPDSVKKIGERIQHIHYDNHPFGKLFNSDSDDLLCDMTHMGDSSLPAEKASGGHRLIPFISIVLKAGNRKLGLLTIVRCGRSFTEDEQSLARSIGNQLSISIENTRLHQEVLMKMTETEQARNEIQQSEQKMRMILESAKDGIMVVDRNFTVIEANEAMKKLCGDKDIIASNIIDILENRDQFNIISILKKAAMTGQTRYIHSLPARKDGASISVEVNIGMIKNATNDPVAFVLCVRDVTEERKRQENMYLTDRLASIGEMAAGVAHELNNPLTGISGLSQLLMENGVSPEVKEDLKIINDEAKRAAAIVKNMLTFARKHAATRQPANINEIIHAILSLRSYEHKTQNIQVSLQLDQHLPDIVIDGFQMQQAFLNIILNAESAMIEAHQRGHLTIASAQIDDIIRISFTDDGPGIAKENLGRIFDPFFTTKEAGKGTGLGLSICYGIVTEHNGKIYARSVPGNGATIFVDLPIIFPENAIQPSSPDAEEQILILRS